MPKRFSFDQTGLVRAEARQVRSSARKVRLVLADIRGRSVIDARAQLLFSPRAVARDIELVLRSAVSNAEVNHGLSPDDLVIHEAFANEGVTIKRFKPRARGRASKINKRTSHITILLRSKASGAVIGGGSATGAASAKADTSRAARVAASKKADTSVDVAVAASTDVAEAAAAKAPAKPKAPGKPKAPAKAEPAAAEAATAPPAAKKPAAKKPAAADGDAEKKPAAPRKRAPKKPADGEKD